MHSTIHTAEKRVQSKPSVVKRSLRQVTSGLSLAPNLLKERQIVRLVTS